MTYLKPKTIQIITFIVLILIPTTVWVHNSYADNRYVQKTESIEDKIESIDNSLFEVNQEISFEENPKTLKKWVARQKYYDNKKKQLVEKLRQKQ